MMKLNKGAKFEIENMIKRLKMDIESNERSLVYFSDRIENTKHQVKRDKEALEYFEKLLGEDDE